MNATQWANFRDFSVASNSQMLFGVSFDKPSSCESASYVWDSSNFQEWAQEVAASDFAPWGFELGNEVVQPRGDQNSKTGFFVHGRQSFFSEPSRLVPAQVNNLQWTTLGCAHPPTATIQADAFSKLQDVVAGLWRAPTRPVVVGPDSGGYDPQPWLAEFFNASSAPFIHVGGPAWE